MAKETIKVLEIDTNPAQTSIKDLRKQLKGFKDEMANLEEGSDAFLEVANKAGQVKHQLDEINESVKGASSDFGDMVGNVTNVAAGITGAFQAVAGGLQAMGVESEAIDQAIAKMQGLMAVTQGLSAIDDGIKSFGKLTTAINTSNKSLGGFKTALIGTGLGALVVVLGSIIANWDEFSEAIGISETAMTKFGDVMKGVLNSALSMIGGVGKAISRLITGDFKGAGEAIKEGFAVQKNFQEGVQQAEEDRTKKQAEEAAKRIALEKEEAQKKYDEFIAKENEKLNIELERLKRKGLAEKEMLEETIKIEEKRLKLMDEDTLEYEQQLTKLHEMKQQLDELNKDREDTTLLPVDDLDKSMQKITKTVDAAKNKIDEFISKCDEISKVGNEQFAILGNTMSLLSESSLGLGNTWTNAIADFQNLFNETMDIVAKKGKTGWESYVQVASAGFQAVGTLLNHLSKDIDTSSEDGFETQKKMQISATVMNMLSGIMSAWASAMQLGPIAGPIFGAINTAATAALGGVQIAKISQQKFGDKGGGSSPKPSTGAVSNMIVPPVQYSSAVQGASTEGAIKDTKVYVTETDITNTQRKVSVQESENTY